MAFEYTCAKCGKAIWISSHYPTRARCKCGGRLKPPGKVTKRKKGSKASV